MPKTFLPSINPLSPQATVTTVWKTPVCKRGVGKRGNLKCPVSYVLNFRGWIKLIYDKITLIYSVKNEFNPSSEVQNIGNRVFQNALFANAPFANASFPNGGYSCLWAKHLSESLMLRLGLGSQGRQFFMWQKLPKFVDSFLVHVAFSAPWQFHTASEQKK